MTNCQVTVRIPSEYVNSTAIISLFNYVASQRNLRVEEDSKNLLEQQVADCPCCRAGAILMPQGEGMFYIVSQSKGYPVTLVS